MSFSYRLAPFPAAVLQHKENYASRAADMRTRPAGETRPAQLYRRVTQPWRACSNASTASRPRPRRVARSSRTGVSASPLQLNRAVPAEGLSLHREPGSSKVYALSFRVMADRSQHIVAARLGGHLASTRVQWSLAGSRARRGLRKRTCLRRAQNNVFHAGSA